MLNANKLPSNSKFIPADPLEPGTYPARLLGVINLGLRSTSYNGQPKEPVIHLQLTYELLDEFMLDENGEEDLSKPRVINEDFPFYSLGSELAKSTKRYLALDPDQEFEGDWTQLLNAPCMVNIIQRPSKKQGDNRVFNNVSNVSTMRPREAAKAPDMVNAPFVFDFYNPDEEAYKSLWPWLQKKLREAIDYKGSDLEEMVDNIVDDEKEETSALPAKNARTGNVPKANKTPTKARKRPSTVDLDDEIPF